MTTSFPLFSRAETTGKNGRTRYNFPQKEAGSTLLDLVMDVLTLAIALLLGGRRVYPARVLLGAAVGTLLAAPARRSGLPQGLIALLWLPIAGAMALAAGADPKRPLRAALLTLASGALLGGLTLALSGATGSLAAGYALGPAIALAAALAAARGRARRAGAYAGRARLTLRYRGRTAAFDAMVDSGNSLRDYLTRRPVIVLPEATARKRLELGGAALRPIFADTAGGRQMMWCFLPEEAALRMGGEKTPLRAAVALSPGLAPDAPALLPQALLGADTEPGSRTA